MPIYLNLLLSITALLVTANIAHAEQVVLRYSQWIPSSHWSQSKGLYPWFEKIREVTEGRVIVEPSKRPLVQPSDSFQAVVDGRIDVAFGMHAYTPGKFPLTELVQQPLLTHHAGQASAAYWRLWEQSLAKTGMHDGMVTMAMHVSSGGNLHMCDQPVKSIQDLEGKRIQTSIRTAGRLLNNFNTRSVTGHLRSLNQEINNAAVDGVAVLDEMAINFGIDKKIKSITHIPGGLYARSIFLGINEQKWNEISPADQTAIRAISGLSLSRKLGDLAHESNIQAAEILKQKLGGNYYTASSEFISELKYASQTEQQKLLPVAKKLGINGIETIALYKSLIADEETNQSTHLNSARSAALHTELAGGHNGNHL